MPRVKLGLRLESLGIPFRDALAAAARLEIPGIQFDAVGELAPEELSQTGRRHLKHLLKTHRLELVCIASSTRRGYDVVDRLEGRIGQTLKTLHLASQLGAPFVVNAVGLIPADRKNPAQLHFFDAMNRIADEALRLGVRLAIETGPESPEHLAQFLADTNSFGLAVNFDPCNLLARGYDPFSAARTLAQNIVGMHVKDVLRTGTTVSGFQEVPLGEGEIDFERLLAVMLEIDYRGFWTLERETASGGEAEFARAAAFLSRF